MELSLFTQEQVDALRTLEGLWGSDAFVLVGASAIGCFIPFDWRRTYDLDLSALVSLDDYPAGLETLSGWRRNPDLEHEWLAPGDVKVDIVPVGGERVDDADLVWPESGLTMSLVGFGLAFDRAVRVKVSDDLEIRAAPLPVIVILKMVAYMDRPAEREKDLEDIACLLDGYLAEGDERRFSREAVELQLDYEKTSAFHLGLDVGEVAGDRERRAVESFTERLRDERDPSASLAKMTRSAPRSWRGDPDIALGRLGAFERGFRIRS